MARRKRHPGSIARHGPGWRVTLTVDGKRHRKTLPTKADAIRWANEAYDALVERGQRAQMGLPVGVTFGQLVDEFEDSHIAGLAPNTKKSYRSTLKPIRHYFPADTPVEKIHAANVQGYLDWRRWHDTDGNRRDNPLHGRSLEHDRAVLSALFRRADKLQYRDGNPAVRVDKPKYDGHEIYILTDDEWRRLEDAARPNPMLMLWLVTLNECGVRPGEALRLQWRDVDLEAGDIHIRRVEGTRVKGGKQRWTPMSAKLRAAMRDHFAGYRLRGSPWVFHHVNTGEPFTLNAMRRIAYRAAKEARIPVGQDGGWTPHALRHRCITNWMESKPPALIKEAVGHADISTTMEYTHLVRRHLQGLVDAEPVATAEATGT